MFSSPWQIYCLYQNILLSMQFMCCVVPTKFWSRLCALQNTSIFIISFESMLIVEKLRNTILEMQQKISLSFYIIIYKKTNSILIVYDVSAVGIINVSVSSSFELARNWWVFTFYPRAWRWEHRPLRRPLCCQGRWVTSRGGHREQCPRWACTHQRRRRRPTPGCRPWGSTENGDSRIWIGRGCSSRHEGTSSIYLIEYPELSLRSIRSLGVQEDTTILDGPVHISDHRPNVPENHIKTILL